MNHAKKGADALSASQFADAIKYYTSAIEATPTSPDYYIKRSTAYQRSTPSDLTPALSDAETAVILAQKRAKRELIIQAQLRRGIALFGLGRYGDAGFIFDVVKRMDPNEKTLGIWESKIKSKLADLSASDTKAAVTVQETPDAKSSSNAESGSGLDAEAPSQTNGQSGTTLSAPPTQTPAPAQTPANKIRYDWYQNSEKVYFTLLAKGVPKDKATIDIQERSLSISFPLVTQSTYDLSLEPLYAAVDPEQSTTSILGTKIEIALRKVQPGLKWHNLESQEPIATSTTGPSDAPKLSTLPARPVPASSAPSYPTSSRSGPKDWDKVASDLTSSKKATSDKSDKKKSASDGANTTSDKKHDDDDWDYEKEDGDEVNGFFKKLYAGATPEVRRAMMKSFTESNGTALSTNWDEVSKGQVATQPPDGMEARKWD